MRGKDLPPWMLDGGGLELGDSFAQAVDRQLGAIPTLLDGARAIA